MGFDVIDAYSRPVRLGEGVALSGTLCGDAIDRTLEALDVCAAKIGRARVTRARHIATEACRRACNGEDFLELVKARTGLRFERVLACKCRNLDQTAKDTQLNLLAVEFAETDSPAGIVSLIFSGGGVIRLDVECLEAELADLGEVSTAEICPDHFAAGTGRARA